MTGIGDLPHLEIVPVANLVLHEYHDEQRTPPLMERLSSSGVLRNPPVVIRMQKQQDHFMVLDGANRVSAFRKLSIPHILVQVISPEKDQVELQAWNHVIWGLPSDELYNSFQGIPEIMLQPSQPSRSFQNLMDLHSLVSIHLPNGKVFTACTSTVDLIDRVKALNKIVNCYCEIASIDRTSVYEIQSLFDLYDRLTALVMLPTFDIHEVLDVVEAGCLMPPGSTRFTIAPRVLHVNYLLEELNSNISIDQKNINLRDYLCACHTSKCVRYYAEPTFVFDD